MGKGVDKAWPYVPIWLHMGKGVGKAWPYVPICAHMVARGHIWAHMVARGLRRPRCGVGGNNLEKYNIRLPDRLGSPHWRRAVKHKPNVTVTHLARIRAAAVQFVTCNGFGCGACGFGNGRGYGHGHAYGFGFGFEFGRGCGRGRGIGYGGSGGSGCGDGFGNASIGGGYGDGITFGDASGGGGGYGDRYAFGRTRSRSPPCPVRFVIYALDSFGAGRREWIW
jgi:hypothetical protein